MEKIKESPLFGYGFNPANAKEAMWEQLQFYLKGDQLRGAHNLIIDLGLKSGVIPIIITLLIFLKLFLNIMTNFRLNDKNFQILIERFVITALICSLFLGYSIGGISFGSF